MARFFIILIALLGAPAVGMPANLFVPSQYPSIQDAISASAAGDNVVVAPGIYMENIDFLGKDILVISTHGPNQTTIDGSGGDVVTFQNGEGLSTILEGFTLTNGNNGIRCLGSSPTLFTCIVSSNTNSGIYLDDSDALAKAIKITMNDNSGVLCTNLATPTITHCAVIDNKGSGIYLEKGSSAIITDNLFSENSAVEGGGIFCRNSSPIITNCTFSANSAYRGGGIQFVCLVANIHPVITNTILWNNAAIEDPEISILETSGTVNLTVTFSDVKGGMTGSGNININPLFQSVASGNFHLYYNSPCVDAGNDNAPYMGIRDLDGNPRIADGDGDGDAGADMGCYEFTPIIVPTDHATIQGAINDADNVGAVFVEPGTYVENIDFLGKILMVKSTDGKEATTIDGNQAGSVVTFQSGEGELSVLKGFKITNGSGTILGGPTTNGGGILCDGTSPTLKQNIIQGNTVTGNGAGIYLRTGASPKIMNNVLLGNTAGIFGGGIFCREESDAIVSGNIIQGNIAVEFGGGIYCWNASPEIKGNTITNNMAQRGGGIQIRGGGIQINYLSAPLIDCNAITDNTADNGGGIYGNQDASVITNNIIALNTANEEGGGIRLIQSLATVNGNTLTSNSAVDGGGFTCEDFTGVLVNSILWNNTATISGPQILLVAGTLDATYCDVMGGWPGTGNIDADPLFVDPDHPDNPDFHLTTGSLCIDAGNINAPSMPQQDMDGDPRIVAGAGRRIYHLGQPPEEGKVDLGADEFVCLKKIGFK